jgi:Bacterial antitoxin of type II TA system, VapB
VKRVPTRFEPCLNSVDFYLHLLESLCRTLVELCAKSLKLWSNLSLDPKLLERTLRVSGQKTKKAAVTKALKDVGAAVQQESSGLEVAVQVRIIESSISDDLGGCLR